MTGGLAMMIKDRVVKRKFYLAHPILVREFIRKKELELEAKLGIELINPFYDGEEKDNIIEVDKGSKSPWDKSFDFTWIIRKDLVSIDESEGIVAWVQKGIPSVGTYMEIWYAFEHGKKVYIVTPDWKDHPWLKYVTHYSGGVIVESFEELEKVLINGK